MPSFACFCESVAVNNGKGGDGEFRVIQDTRVVIPICISFHLTF